MAKRRKKSSKKAKYSVVCGKSVRSNHRKKSAANKAKPAGCHVRKNR